MFGDSRQRKMVSVVLLCLVVTGAWSSRLPAPGTRENIEKGDWSRIVVGKRVQSSRKHDLASLCKDCLINDDPNDVPIKGQDRERVSIPSTYISRMDVRRLDIPCNYIHKFQHKRKHNGTRHKRINSRRGTSDILRASNSSNSLPEIRIKVKSIPANQLIEMKGMTKLINGGTYADQGGGKKATGSTNGRWSRQRLRQVPDVARLERRLHPTVTSPVREIMQSLSRMLHQLTGGIGRNEVDYKYIFNSTRYTIMMGVRTHLMQLWEQNNKVYDAVMQASLLTKYIYLRAHERRRLGYDVLDNGATSVAAAAASSRRLSKVADVDVHKYSRSTHEELRKSERLKRRVFNQHSGRSSMVSRFVAAERRMEERIDSRAMQDLQRKANEIITALTNHRSRLDFEEKLHLYSHMRQDDLLGFSMAKTTMQDAKDSLKQAQKQFMIGKKASSQIARHLGEHTNGAVADMPFDDTRLLLWATVDSTTKHADSLYMKAAQIHGSLNSLILKGNDKLLRKDSGALERRLNAKMTTLKQQIKDVDQLLDRIRVVIGDEDILRDRCEDTASSGKDDEHRSAVIDCDLYVTIEGSGDDLEGSGETEASDVDIFLPVHEYPRNLTPVSSVNKDYTKNNADSLMLLNTTINIEDEELLPVKETTTTTATVKPSESDDTTTADVDKDTSKSATQEPDKDSVESDEDFTFTDMFGFFSDDPNASSDDPGRKKPDDMSNSNGVNGDKKHTLNTLILVRLREFVNVSQALNRNASKTKERTLGLSKQWETVEEVFSKFANNTGIGKAFVREWAAKRLVFESVHAKVQDMKNITDLKIPIIERKCTSLAATANAKVVEVERRYEERQEKQTGARPDPVDVTEAVNAVNQVKTDVEEIVKLKQILPEPCRTVHTTSARIQANITELRRKIEIAKSIASSIQRAVTMSGKGYIAVSMDQGQEREARLTSVLEIDIKPTDVDGQVAVLQTPEIGTTVLSIEDRTPSVSVFDTGGYVIGEAALANPMETNSWYRTTIQRTATTYFISVLDLLNNTTAVSNVTVGDQKAAQPAPSILYLGGVPDNHPIHDDGYWQGCIGNMVVDGRFVNTWRTDSGGNKPIPCSETSPPGVKGSMILGGSGYTSFSPATILGRARDIQQIQLTFRAYSDGMLLSFKLEHSRTVGQIIIKSGRLVATMKHRLGEVELESNEDVYIHGIEYDLEITFKGNLRGPKSIIASLNGDATVFKIRSEKAAIAASNNGFFLGGNPVHNRSASACIKAVYVNSKEIKFSMLDDLVDAYYGSCPETNCVEFTDLSTAIDLEEANNDDIYIAFVYGTYGPLVQYTKGDKYSITVNIDTDGLEIIDAENDEEGIILLTDMEYGDQVIVTITDADSKVQITCVGVTKEFSYKSGGGWFGIGGDDDKLMHKLTIAGSTDADVNFEGKIVDIIINQQSLDTSQYLQKNGLKRCTATKPLPAQHTEKADDTFSCLV